MENDQRSKPKTKEDASKRSLAWTGTALTALAKPQVSEPKSGRWIWAASALKTMLAGAWFTPRSVQGVNPPSTRGRCSSQLAGSGRSGCPSISDWSVCPERIVSTMSGANSASRRIRLT
jgi:hypothetical protein